VFESLQEEGNTRSTAHRITDAGARVLHSGISAHAAALGNENGSFFSPLLALPKNRRSRSERGGALLAKRAEEVARRHGSSASSSKEEKRRVRTGVNSLAHEEDRQLAGVPARHYVLQRSVAQSWPREAWRVHLFAQACRNAAPRRRGLSSR
jgi:hypothetical protein